MQKNKTLIEAGHIWTFPGGIHPPERKHASSTPIAQLPLPEQLILPVRQHIGEAAELLVKPGDQVLKGQALTASNQHGQLPVHAPTSGRVDKIASSTIAHPSGLTDTCIFILPDGLDREAEKHPIVDYRICDRGQLLAHIKQAGIAGLGGAGFPTAQKLAQQKPLDYLIINGVECEPYICADDRLMREYAEEIITGIEILMYLSSAPMTLLAVEDNKPEAIASLTQALGDRADIQLRVVPTKYPSGGEKQLIQLLTEREVPSRGLPIDIGLVMQNVATAFAVKRAIVDGEALIERVVTVTGNTIAQPGNYWIRLGTPVAHVLQATGFTATPKQRVVMGGPMMGFALGDLQVPIVKISNCILVPEQQELPPAPAESPCIRCGACSDVCPASLLPQQLYWHAKSKDHEALETHNLFDCIECGACAYVCPSAIPLVHYYRQAKAEIRNLAREKARAEIARERFEARQQRLEREQQERLERHRKAAEARKKSQAEAAKTPGKDPQAAVKAALERAKARKAKQQAAANTSKDDGANSEDSSE